MTSLDRINNSLLSPSSDADDDVRHSSDLHHQPDIDDVIGWGSVALGVLLSFFIIVALAGNLLVIAAIATDRHLRETGNWFLLSLAVADAMVAVVVMTLAMVNDVLGRWVFGRALCDLWLSADVMCSTASILSLWAVSLDRYVHIRNPLDYDRWMTSGRVMTFIVTVWTLSALISLVPIHLGWHRRLNNDGDDDATTTIISTTDDRRDVILTLVTTQTTTTTKMAEPSINCVLELNPLYAILSSVVSFYIPCISMIAIYIRMYSHARHHAQSIRRSMPPSTTPAGVPLTNPGPPTAPHPQRPGYDLEFGPQRRRRSSVSVRVSDSKAAITLGVLMGVFLFCWIPFFSVNVVNAVCRLNCVPPQLFSVFSWLGYVNSTMNPVIYSVFNRQFRHAFKRIIRRISASLCPCLLMSSSLSLGI